MTTTPLMSHSMGELQYLNLYLVLYLYLQLPSIYVDYSVRMNRSMGELQYLNLYLCNRFKHLPRCGQKKVTADVTISELFLDIPTVARSTARSPTTAVSTAARASRVRPETITINIRRRRQRPSHSGQNIRKDILTQP